MLTVALVIMKGATTEKGKEFKQEGVVPNSNRINVYISHIKAILTESADDKLI